MAIDLYGRNDELRRKLDLGKKTISAHHDAVKALKGHTIRAVERPNDGTCVTWALGLLDEYRGMCKELQTFGVKPGAEFVHWMVDEGKLVEVETPRPGLLALYFDGEVWKHMALLAAHDRLVSKWGKQSVFDHGMAEVPAEYGNVVRFFAKPEPDQAARMYFDYACEVLNLSADETDAFRMAVNGLAPSE
jgi:hypothetical protein